ncbi:hypothetical protein [Achromobacter sp. DMS1]|uniref:hypothetical protein n=1 Tax=Achromobacter sp. DMS1 TaxID=1688405 RepID=UPI001F43C89A|nr:hypothetical protein [Achromobacter sp. DMS1]
MGLRDTPDSFIDQLLDEGARHGVIRLRTTLDSRKDYIHVDDAVAQILALALSDEAGIFNIAQGAGASNGQVAQWIARKLGYRIEVCDAAARWDFPDIDVGASSRASACRPAPSTTPFPCISISTASTKESECPTSKPRPTRIRSTAKRRRRASPPSPPMKNSAPFPWPGARWRWSAST